MAIVGVNSKSRQVENRKLGFTWISEASIGADTPDAIHSLGVFGNSRSTQPTGWLAVLSVEGFTMKTLSQSLSSQLIPHYPFG